MDLQVVFNRILAFILSVLSLVGIRINPVQPHGPERAVQR